jgi:hypothetical protein
MGKARKRKTIIIKSTIRLDGRKEKEIRIRKTKEING